jgi:hypothetical protein
MKEQGWEFCGDTIFFFFFFFMNNYLIEKINKIGIFSSFSEIQKLKKHIFKVFWDTMWCTTKPMDLSNGAREDIVPMIRRTCSLVGVLGSVVFDILL